MIEPHAYEPRPEVCLHCGHPPVSDYHLPRCGAQITVGRGALPTTCDGPEGHDDKHYKLDHTGACHYLADP